MSTREREYELILFGATGYTGLYCAEHIATHLPTDLRWAVAGRSAPKLSAVIDEIKSLNPDRLEPGMYHSAGYGLDTRKLMLVRSRGFLSHFRRSQCSSKEDKAAH